MRGRLKRIKNGELCPMCGLPWVECRSYGKEDDERFVEYNGLDMKERGFRIVAESKINDEEITFYKEIDKIEDEVGVLSPDEVEFVKMVKENLGEDKDAVNIQG